MMALPSFFVKRDRRITPKGLDDLNETRANVVDFQIFRRVAHTADAIIFEPLKPSAALEMNRISHFFGLVGSLQARLLFYVIIS